MDAAIPLLSVSPHLCSHRGSALGTYHAAVEDDAGAALGCSSLGAGALGK